jgi:hypothetical protein
MSLYRSRVERLPRSLEHDENSKVSDEVSDRGMKKRMPLAAEGYRPSEPTHNLLEDALLK